MYVRHLLEGRQDLNTEGENGKTSMVDHWWVSLLTTTMKQAILFEAIFFVIFVIQAVVAGDKQLVKIVNSTNARELKLNIPKEDKSGAVAYVYAVESTEPSTTEAPTTSHSKRPHTEPSTTEKQTTRNCVTIVIEKMKGDERTVYYKATKEEAESAGKNIVDTVCEDDEKYDLINKKNLANLKDDIYHLP